MYDSGIPSFNYQYNFVALVQRRYPDYALDSNPLLGIRTRNELSRWNVA